MRGWNLGQWFRPTSGDTEGRGKTRSKDENNSPTCIHLDLIITKQPLRETEFFRNLLGKLQRSPGVSNQPNRRGVGPHDSLSLFQLLTVAVRLQNRPTWFCTRCSNAPTRINTEVFAPRRALDRLQNRLQRCSGQTRCPTYCKLERQRTASVGIATQRRPEVLRSH